MEPTKSAILSGKVETAVVATSDDEASVLKTHGLERDSAGLLRWCLDSTYHPRNWGTSKKSYSIGVIILLELYTSVVLPVVNSSYR